MRPITRNLVVGLLVFVGLLLALGAVPSHIQTGDPYHVEATAIDVGGPSVDADVLSERRFPYTFGALNATAGTAPGRSEPYYTGPVGFKEGFTHTPFEEFEEFEGRNSAAVERSADSPVGDIAYVEFENQRYRLEILRTQEGTR